MNSICRSSKMRKNIDLMPRYFFVYMYDIVSFHEFVAAYLSAAGFACTFRVIKPTVAPSAVLGITSLFRMKHGYRDFARYIGPLTQTITANPTTNWRVYCDASTEAEAVAAFRRLPNVELVVFDFPQFRIGQFHQGCFGTLPRMLNLFDFEGRHPLALICDADLKLMPADVDHIRDKCRDVYSLFYDCPQDIIAKEDRLSCSSGAFVLMTFCMTSRPVSRDVLKAFLNALGDPFIRDWAARKFSKPDSSSSKTAQKSRPKGAAADYGPFHYGIDEVFMNCWIAPEWLAQGFDIIGVRYAFNVAKLHYSLYKKILAEPQLKNSDDLCSGPREIFAGLVDTGAPPKSLMKQIDAIVWGGGKLMFHQLIRVWHEYMLYLCELYLAGKIDTEYADCPAEYLKHRDLYLPYHQPKVYVFGATPQLPNWKQFSAGTNPVVAAAVSDGAPALLLFTTGSVPADAARALVEHPRLFDDGAIMVSSKDFLTANGFSNRPDGPDLATRLSAAGIKVFGFASTAPLPVTTNDNGFRQMDH